MKECGVLVIDLGGGTTTYLAYAGGAIAAAGALAVGGDHITNDVSQGFNLSLKRAEILKHESGRAVVDPSRHFQKISVPDEVGFSACTVGLSDLDAVINVRVDELFRLIKHELESRNLLHSLGAGVVLTGGGGYLRGVESLAEMVFDLPCAIGKPKNVSGVASMYEGLEYASLLGMIRYALRTLQRQAKAISLGGMLRRFFDRLY